jgi:hypothetical protein
MAYLEVVSLYLVYFANPMYLKYDKRGALCIEWLIRGVAYREVVSLYLVVFYKPNVSEI